MIQRVAARLPRYRSQVLVNLAIHDVLRRVEVWETDSLCSVWGRSPFITHLWEEALLVWGPQNLHWGRVSQHQHSPPLCTQISTKQCQDTHLYKNPLVKPVVSVVINSFSLVNNQPGANLKKKKYLYMFYVNYSQFYSNHESERLEISQTIYIKVLLIGIYPLHLVIV